MDFQFEIRKLVESGEAGGGGGGDNIRRVRCMYVQN